MKLNKSFLVGGVLASALVLGACGANVSADDMEWETEENKGSVTVKDNTETASGTTAQQAVDKALKEFEGTVTDVEYDEDDGVYYYDVEIENGNDDFEVKLNAEDLSIIEQDLERDDEDDNDRDDDRDDVESDDDDNEVKAAEKSSSQSAENNGSTKLAAAFKDDKAAEAIEAAHKNFDGILEGVSYEEDDGVYYYEVKLENKNEEYEVKLKADDLSVLEEEHEDENNDRGFKRLEAAQEEKIISLKQAKETAAEAVNGEIDEWDYDVDDFKYEFEIGDYEVKVNAKTGDVTEIDD
ncbi:MAG: PepSY domain-containing protein [Jeotgalicoccus sp.]